MRRHAERMLLNMEAETGLGHLQTEDQPRLPRQPPEARTEARDSSSGLPEETGPADTWLHNSGFQKFEPIRFCCFKAIQFAVIYYGRWASLGAQWWRICLQSGRPQFSPWSGRPPGRGDGHPLQCSCLENPMDRGAWRATVHGFARIRIQLRQLNMHTLWQLQEIVHTHRL